jgi:carbon starvation protein CstA
MPLSQDTGAFWFWSAESAELMVKVVDGRAVNGHFWVFVAGLSNVAYTVTVVDTATGSARQYVNPAGRLQSRADTAF